MHAQASTTSRPDKHGLLQDYPSFWTQLFQSGLFQFFLFYHQVEKGREGDPSFFESIQMLAVAEEEGFVPILIFLALLFVSFFYLALPMLIAGQWRTFEKGGKPGWACLVPIYNLICMIEIGKSPTWWIILMFVPFINIVFAVLLLNALVKSFDKDGGWTVGIIFLPFIFYPMLAWGDAHYQYGDFESGDLNVEDHLVE